MARPRPFFDERDWLLGGGGKGRLDEDSGAETLAILLMLKGSGRLRVAIPPRLGQARRPASSRPALARGASGQGSAAAQIAAPRSPGHSLGSLPSTSFHFALTSHGRRADGRSPRGAERTARRLASAGTGSAGAFDGPAVRMQRYVERLDTADRKGELLEDAAGAISLGNLGASAQERVGFWAAVERQERRSDARVQSRLIAELPHWLAPERQRRIVSSLGAELAKRGLGWWGVVHQPEVAAGSDPRNVHAHLLFHDRPAEQDADGAWRFARLKDREVQTSRFVAALRRRFAEIVNDEILGQSAESGIAPPRVYDPRSYRDAGLAKQPTYHLGRSLTNLERAGEPTALGEENRRREWDWRHAVECGRARRFLRSATDLVAQLPALEGMPAAAERRRGEATAEALEEATLAAGRLVQAPAGGRQGSGAAHFAKRRLAWAERGRRRSRDPRRRRFFEAALSQLRPVAAGGQMPDDRISKTGSAPAAGQGARTAPRSTAGASAGARSAPGREAAPAEILERLTRSVERLDTAGSLRRLAQLIAEEEAARRAWLEADKLARDREARRLAARVETDLAAAARAEAEGRGLLATAVGHRPAGGDDRDGSSTGGAGAAAARWAAELAARNRRLDRSGVSALRRLLERVPETAGSRFEESRLLAIALRFALGAALRRQAARDGQALLELTAAGRGVSAHTAEAPAGPGELRNRFLDASRERHRLEASLPARAAAIAGRLRQDGLGVRRDGDGRPFVPVRRPRRPRDAGSDSQRRRDGPQR